MFRGELQSVPVLEERSGGKSGEMVIGDQQPAGTFKTLPSEVEIVRPKAKAMQMEITAVQRISRHRAA